MEMSQDSTEISREVSAYKIALKKVSELFVRRLTHPLFSTASSTFFYQLTSDGRKFLEAAKTLRGEKKNFQGNF